ncbi:MAG: hypothetical protein ACHQRM_13455 [Bacteroidia bacterium]
MKTSYIYSIIGLFSANFLTAQDSLHTPSTFKPEGKLWGLAFGDYAFKTHNDTLGRGGGNVQYKGTNALNSNNVVSGTNPVPANVQSNAFQIRRAYVGYDYNISRRLSAYVVLANEQTLLPNNQNTVYLKYAYLKWSNLWKGTDLVFGQFQTASYSADFGVSPLWGYRSVERTILDFHNIDASTDLGVSLQGKIWQKKSSPDSVPGSFLGYYLQLGNGNSATPESDPYKKVRVSLYASLFKQKLVLGVYGDYSNQQYSPYHTSNTTINAYVSYRGPIFHIGVEVFGQRNQNSDIYKVYDPETKKLSATNDTATGIQIGFSLFGSARIIKNKLNVFARYDSYNPDISWNTNNVYSKANAGITGSNLNSATFYTQSFVTTGLDWTPDKRFHIMPNFWWNGNNAMMSSAGPSGTGKLFGSRTVKDEDVVFRVTFFYIFNSSKEISGNGFY